MRLLILIMVCVVICPVSQSDTLTIDWDSLLEPGLQQYNLTTKDFLIQETHLKFSGSVEVSPFHQLLIQDPLENHRVVYQLTNYFADYPTHYVGGYLLNLSILLDQRIQHGVTRDWSSDTVTFDHMLQEIQQLGKSSSNPLTDNQLDHWRDEFGLMPEPLQRLLYEFLVSLNQAYAWLVLNEESAQALNDLPRLYTKPSSSSALLKKEEQFQEQFDLRYLLLASVEMCQFLTELLERQTELSQIDLNKDINLQTSMGNIMVSGKADSVYELEQAPLLLLDFGGDDTYLNAYSQADLTTPFSITIDFAGQDRYLSKAESLGAGSAIGGFSAMIDLGEGDDQYEGEHECFGYSFSGVSIIMNASGTTTYKTKTKSLGMAERGIALLVDGDGDDTYESISYSQGCGVYVGAGCLIDLGGNDQYIASATPVLFASAQIPEQNMSASQGFGSGRYVYSNGFSAPGGVGMLIDREGNDRYQASVFGQGVGYGFGVGILSDLQGDDHYSTSWYGKGSAAHKACGILLDMQGDDRVEGSHYMIGGTATDLALGAFYNFGGNDDYSALNASFGYALDNSFALFYDQGGNDRYTIKNLLGYGVAKNNLEQSIRYHWPTFSIFIDHFGDDQYIGLKPRDHSHWFSSPEDRLNQLYGIGVDIEND